MITRPATWRGITRPQTWKTIIHPKTWRVQYMIKLFPRAKTTTNQSEPKKSIISNKPRALIVWHFWTVVSVTVSIALIYLNLTQYTIGREVGANPAGTANIIGALQLAIKAHELSIVASLYLIARQWIQGCLMDINSGTVLGLVGAERSLAAPSFLISAEFRAAAGKGISGNLRVGALAMFLFSGCVISSLAGPASGALMIPRVDWFFEKELNYPNMPSDNYPHILIDPRLGHGVYKLVNNHVVIDPEVLRSTLSGLDYWEQFYVQQTSLGVVRVQDTVHEFTDILGRRYTNSSTIWGRSLDGNWTGGTVVSTAMNIGINYIRNALYSEKSQDPRDQHLAPSTESSTYVTDLQRWSGRKYVTNAKGIQSQVQCRQRRKQQCTGAVGNSSHWCYMSGRNDDQTATIQSSQNLLLMVGEDTGDSVRGVYIVEGPRALNQYSKYSPSVEIIIDDGDGIFHGGNSGNQTYINYQLNPQYITLCSITTMLRSTIVSSLHIPFSPQYAEYTNYLSYSNGEHQAPRTILYHENWLDFIHQWQPSAVDDGSTTIVVATGNVTYQPRNMSRLTYNPTLARFAKIFLTGDPGSADDIQGHMGRGGVEAAALEIVIGGAYLQLMSFISPTNSQYSVVPGVALPDSLMPEPRRSFPASTTYIIKVYNQGYGFRLSSRTGLLGMIVLITHATIAVLGSLWLVFWERRVISAWDTIPDYMALGIGSFIAGKGLKNTCAGISGTKTLGTLVVVGETTPQHLEITLPGHTKGTPSDRHPKSVLTRDRYGNKYGYRDSGPRRKEKLE